MLLNSGYTEVTDSVEELILEFRNVNSVASSPWITPKKVLRYCIWRNIKPL